METITNLIKDTPIPKMVRVRQNFDKTCIPESDIPGIILRELDRPEIGGKIRPGQKIAITCGSRGINHNALMARTIVDFVKSKGAVPYIVAAMGSHGGATAEGQLQILKDYGITEEAMGCPVKSSMETVQIGISGVRHQPVFMDKNASEADGIILFNRIKPHTSFRGPYESGLMKMMAIGLGKQKGAESIHHQSPAIMHELVEEYGRTILENAPVLGGIAIIENAYDDTYLIKGLSPEEIITEEPKLKEISYKTIAHLLFDKCDVLVVDKIGKNISGDGMDPNVSGTFGSPGRPRNGEPGPILAQRTVVLDLTDESHGNFNGIGVADVTTKRLIDKSIVDVTYPNALTSTLVNMVKMPIFAHSDENAIKLAVRVCNMIDKQHPRIVRIANTMELSHIWVSEALVEEVKDHPHMELDGELQDWGFDENGNLW